jgi:Cu/Ag efflux protein CusF
MSLALPAFADGNAHGHGHGEGEGEGEGIGKGHMKSGGMQAGGMGGDMREVMAEGRLNKIMADKHMVNIKHGPIPEMNWPKMNMNFKTSEQVDLKALKPGQKVEFKLLVDGDNNYVIKEIMVK